LVLKRKKTIFKKREKEITKNLKKYKNLKFKKLKKNLKWRCISFKYHT